MLLLISLSLSLSPHSLRPLPVSSSSSSFRPSFRHLTFCLSCTRSRPLPFEEEGARTTSAESHFVPTCYRLLVCSSPFPACAPPAAASFPRLQRLQQLLVVQ
jgi:hypothetical protein